MSELPVSTPHASAAINLRRLLAVRAITLSGLLITLWFAVARLGMALPTGTLLLVLAAMTGLSLATLWRLARPRPVGDCELFAQLLADVAALTVVLYYSGGSTNPFVTLYLLPLAMTAAALPGARVWWMAGITVACYSALYVWHVPMPHAAHAHGAEFGIHVAGMWLGFVLSAGLIAAFAARMSATLRERDQTLAAMREAELRNERVLALGTLAAGAAHELGTPLATMAVLTKDIEPERGIDAERLGILRTQIARCKEILSSLSAAAGEVRAEAGASRPLDAWLTDIVARWRATRPGVVAALQLDGARPAPQVVAEQTLAQAITNILNNAADASPQQVEIGGHWSSDALTLEIADRGPGLAPELAGQAGQPFLTTKSEGLGLGLFLAYTTLSRLGGDVRLINRDGGGVLCRLTLPLAALKVND